MQIHPYPFGVKYHVFISRVLLTVHFWCSFEQEVLGGPIPVSGSPPLLEAVPVALPLPAVVRPIIGTNTYRQVCTLLATRCQKESFIGVQQSKKNSIVYVVACRNGVMLKYHH